MTTRYTQRDCSTCLIGNAMRQCPQCAFYQGYEVELPTFHNQATDADIFRIFRQLWGMAPPSYVYSQYQAQEARGFELMDITQTFSLTD